MVELIVVIVILGALAAMALPRLTDLGADAEGVAVKSWVGALKSAQSLAFAAAMVANAGYTSPDQMSLWNLVRCDANPMVATDGRPAWQGHHLALAGLRSGVFQSADATACNGNTISFATKTNRSIRITNSAAGITWSATPPY